MTCKDCIHYDVCCIVENSANKNDDYLTEFGCNDFVANDEVEKLRIVNASMKDIVNNYNQKVRELADARYLNTAAANDAIMREKLIELLAFADNQCANTKQCENCVGFGKGKDCCNYLIADYLLDNGVVVMLCKVGDTVYLANPVYGEVLEATVISVEFNYYTDPKEWITIEYISPYTGKQTYKSRIDLMFGKTAFLTKEEAEKHLKGVNNEQIH